MAIHAQYRCSMPPLTMHLHITEGSGPPLSSDTECEVDHPQRLSTNLGQHVLKLATQWWSQALGIPG